MNITGDKNQTTSSMNKPTSKKLQTPFLPFRIIQFLYILKQHHSPVFLFTWQAHGSLYKMRIQCEVLSTTNTTNKIEGREGEGEKRTHATDGCCVRLRRWGGEEATDELLNKYTDYFHSRNPLQRHELVRRLNDSRWRGR